jgi:hypothetical protein
MVAFIQNYLKMPLGSIGNDQNRDSNFDAPFAFV